MQKYDALYLRGRKKIKKTNLETTDAVREGESYNLKNVGVRAIYDQNKQKHTNKLTSNSAITLVALVITIIFSYDEKLKCSNSKGFLLQTI